MGAWHINTLHLIWATIPDSPKVSKVYFRLYCTETHPSQLGNRSSARFPDSSRGMSLSVCLSEGLPCYLSCIGGIKNRNKPQWCVKCPCTCLFLCTWVVPCSIFPPSHFLSVTINCNQNLLIIFELFNDVLGYRKTSIWSQLCQFFLHELYIFCLV